MHTQGQVVNYHCDNLPMPVVEFIVNGTPHQVKGPLGVSAFDYVVIAVGVILCIVGIVTLII